MARTALTLSITKAQVLVVTWALAMERVTGIEPASGRLVFFACR